MQNKRRFPYGKVIASLLLLGFIFIVWNLFNRDSRYPWIVYELNSGPNGLAKIEFVDINSTLNDPTGDVVYVSDENGIIYSNEIFNNTWSPIEAGSNWETEYAKDCTQRLAPYNTPIWDKPPVEQDVIDSFGVIFERPFSIIIRCYILFDDGNLEVWIHSTIDHLD